MIPAVKIQQCKPKKDFKICVIWSIIFVSVCLTCRVQREVILKLQFCSLYSGSSGNCQLIKTDKTTILVDAGLSGVKIQQEIKNLGADPKAVAAIFITHEHSDHIQGAGILSRRYDIPIYANQETWEAMEPIIGNVKPHNVKLVGDGVEIGDMYVSPFDISHDAAHPVGYNIYKESKKICLVTDTGCINDDIVENVKNSDLMLVESNHDEDMVLIGRYPWPLKRRVLSEVGHMSNDTAGELITKALKKGTEIVLLGHLSKENNFPELAFKTVENILKAKGIEVNPGVRLAMTYRDRASAVYEI